MMHSPFLFFLFFGKNLISCTCRCESCSSVDASHQNRHQGGNKNGGVPCLIYRISIKRGHGEGWRVRGRRCSGMFVSAALLVSGFGSWDCRWKAESVQLPGSSSSAEPRVVNDAFQRRMSHTGSQSIPPNCGGPVWLWYQLVWGMAGRQERIKRGCKEKREDGSTSLPAMKLFCSAGKQARNPK